MTQPRSVADYLQSMRKLPGFAGCPIVIGDLSLLHLQIPAVQLPVQSSTPREGSVWRPSATSLWRPWLFPGVRRERFRGSQTSSSSPPLPTVGKGNQRHDALNGLRLCRLCFERKANSSSPRPLLCAPPVPFVPSIGGVGGGDAAAVRRRWL